MERRRGLPCIGSPDSFSSFPPDRKAPLHPALAGDDLAVCASQQALGHKLMSELPNCSQKANCLEQNFLSVGEDMQVLPEVKSLMSGLCLRGDVCAEDGES